MIISMIAAMAKKRVIGLNNQMPWHLPADLGHFKRTTLGKPVIMGRKTYESIGKALPGRTNIVVTRDTSYQLEDALVVTSCEAALDAAQTAEPGLEEVMIIGGGTIYQYFLPMCQRLYLTEIALEVDGDTHFPDYQAQGQWQKTSSEPHQADEKNPYAYEFFTLERVN